MLETSYTKLLRKSSIDAFVRQAYYGVYICDITCPVSRKFTSTVNTARRASLERIVMRVISMTIRTSGPTSAACATRHTGTASTSSST